MDILKLLLYVLLIVFPLGVIIRINVITSVYIYPLDIVLFLIYLYTILINFKTKKKIYNLPLFKPIYMFIVFSFITLLLNIKFLSPESFFVSFLYIFKFILYTNMIFIFSFLGRDLAKKYIFWMCLSGFSSILFGFLQYIFYPDLRKLYYLGWDEHLYRMFSTFLDPNFAGPIFVLDMLLLLGLFLSSFIYKKRIIIFLLVGLLFSFIAIFYTYSRSTFIMFVISLLTFLTMIKKKRFIYLIFIIFAIGIFILPKDIKSEGVVLLRTASIISREDSYKTALVVFKDSPVFGIGFNAYRYAKKRYNFSDPRNWETTHPGAGVSNSFLFVLVTTGILGFILYLNLLLNLVKNIIRVMNDKSIYLKATVVSSLIGVITHSMFENSLFYPSVMFWIFSLVGSFLVMEEK